MDRSSLKTATIYPNASHLLSRGASQLLERQCAAPKAQYEQCMRASPTEPTACLGLGRIVVLYHR
jgi:hypothetical protein